MCATYSSNQTWNISSYIYTLSEANSEPCQTWTAKTLSAFGKVLDTSFLLVPKVFKTFHAKIELLELFLSPIYPSGQNSTNHNEIISHTPKYKKGMILLKVT